MKNFHFGENLRMMRIYRGYTQEAMAKDLNMSQGTYSKIEYSKEMPDNEMIINLTEILRFRPKDLISANWYAHAVNGDSKKNRRSVATISVVGQRAYAVLLAIGIWDSTLGAAAGTETESINIILLIGCYLGLGAFFLYHFTVKHVEMAIEDDTLLP